MGSFITQLCVPTIAKSSDHHCAADRTLQRTDSFAKTQEKRIAQKQLFNPVNLMFSTTNDKLTTQSRSGRSWSSLA